MAISENDMAKAQEVYENLCTTLSEADLKYEREDEELKIVFTLYGEDIPMKFVVYINPAQYCIRLISWLPFEIVEAKMVDAAVVTCAINQQLGMGTFMFDIADGSVGFKLVQSYMDSEIGKDLLLFMISISQHIVDRYNDKYLMLSKGNLSLKDFLAEINQ